MRLPGSKKLDTMINTLRNNGQTQKPESELREGIMEESNSALPITNGIEKKFMANRRHYIRYALAAGGVSLLVISYFLSSIILTFMGLGLVLWAVLLLYITQSRFVHQDIAVSPPVSLIRTIDSMLVGMGYAEGRPVFFYPRSLKGMEQGAVFVSLDEKLHLPTDEQLMKGNVLHDNPKGISLTAPSASLVDLFEKRLNTKFGQGDIASIEEFIPSLLTEELRIVDDVIVDKKDEHSFSLTMIGGPAVETCKIVGSETRMGNSLGCPMCGAFALIFSKISGKPVFIKHTIFRENSVETIFEELGEAQK